MKILILSKEAWRDEQNGGNVLSNIFASFDAEFAQIYCTDIEPNNTICKTYYKITDKMMVHSILGKGMAGVKMSYDDYPQTVYSRESYRDAKKWLPGSFVRIMREVVWKIGRWNENEIAAFVKQFNPDIIFAPCYANHYMLRMTSLVYGIVKKPIISYISDDFYTNKQFDFSPIFWLNHFMLRKHVRNTFKLYSLCYTMTDEQCEQCRKDLHANMKVLRKCGRFDEKYQKQIVGSPIKLVYGGGIYVNRYETLKKLAIAIRNINRDGVLMTLDIYTNSELSDTDYTLLNDGISSKMHKAVSLEKLRSIYHESDIALHVEGFDLKSRLTVRMSFSTKIIDCMDSGCAVMAICDSKQAGGAYLRRNDCAICINRIDQIEDKLREILNNQEVLLQYQHKAFEVGRKNHLQDQVDEGLKSDFAKYSII